MVFIDRKNVLEDGKGGFGLIQIKVAFGEKNCVLEG